jgi:carboxymethylenebutenolidase
MNAESLNLKTSRGATTAYVARPEKDVTTGVLLIQEYWGINEHIRDLADRFASEGYLCVAPDSLPWPCCRRTKMKQRR